MVSIWKGIFDLVENVPPVIWSGVIASMLTLGGVLLANRDNTKRLLVQLDHDGKQKDRDRLLNLRKDVYLQAPKEAVKAMAYLGNLPTRDLTKMGDDEGIFGYVSTSAQIGVISELSTAGEVNRLAMMLAARLVETVWELRDVQSLRSDIDIGAARLETLNIEIRRILAEQQKMAEDGVHDAARSEALRKWSEFNMQEFHDLRLELDDLRNKYQRALYEHAKESSKRTPEMAAQQIKIMAAIRKEIGLSDDLDAFEKQMTEQGKALQERSLAIMKETAEWLENKGEASSPDKAPDEPKGE
jgi:hypothetical protein